MRKLLTAKTPNAAKILAYLNAHPMAKCLMTVEEIAQCKALLGSSF